MGRRVRQENTWLAHVVPGLEDIAAKEIRSCFPDARILRTEQRFDERTSLLLFTAPVAPRDLVSLRMVEDVFALAAESEHIPSSRAGLASVRTLLSESRRMDQAAAATVSVRPRRSRPTIRVIARKAGDHAYRRIDLQRAAEQALLARYPRWRLVEDDAQLELWIHLVERHAIAAFRLSSGTMRQRTYRETSLPAALKPTIAAAMVALSHPQADDVFLDPMCGSGTILIERALAAPYRLLLGGDHDPAAAQATRDNVGPRYKPIRVEQWDARRLPLEDQSVSALVCNLPFGKQIGSAEENRTLYPALLTEWIRVLQPGARVVLLTSECDLLLRSLRRIPALQVERRLPVLVRGLWATIFVLRHTY